MAKKSSLRGEHYLLMGVLVAVAASFAAYFNSPFSAIGRTTNDRTPPAISSVAVGSMIYNLAIPDKYSVTVNWITDEPASSVLCESKTKLLRASQFTNCTGVNTYTTSHSIAMNMSSGVHYYVVRSTDAAGNIGASNILTLTVPVLPATDATPPSATITSPAANNIVSGLVTVSIAASDNIGVTQVQLKVDGVVRGVTTISPYLLSWNTTLVANGAHTLQALALDAASNTGSSVPVTVFVSNVVSTTTATSTL